MGRKRKQPRRRADGTAAGTQTAPGRREALNRMIWAAIGGTVLVGGGGAFALDLRARLAEADLTRLGQGRPAIVQIHDPNCTLCRELQRETRAALKAIDGPDVLYLVANIRSEAGAAFAAEMGEAHVSLVLFDGAGHRQHTVRGVTPRDELETVFRRVLGAG